MKEQGAIDHAIFSMSIATGDTQNMMTFGGYDLHRFATGPIHWHNIMKGFLYKHHWTLKFEEFRFHGHPSWTEDVNFKNKIIIVDSGTSLILLPEKDLRSFFKVLKVSTGVRCT